MNHRLLEVGPERLERWTAGFGERHGAVEVSVDEESVVLTAADGATAVLAIPFPPADLGENPVVGLAARAAQPRDALVLLVRRGGYAVGTVQQGALVKHKVGTKYVQSRTAAGGWSQQRFARRRQGQAAGLVGAATEVAVTQWAGAMRAPAVLVTGGDRQLVEDVLADPRLHGAARLLRGPLLDVRDPRLDILKQSVQRSRQVRVGLTEPS